MKNFIIMFYRTIAIKHLIRLVNSAPSPTGEGFSESHLLLNMTNHFFQNDFIDKLKEAVSNFDSKQPLFS